MKLSVHLVLNAAECYKHLSLVNEEIPLIVCALRYTVSTAKDEQIIKDALALLENLEIQAKELGIII